MSDFMIRFLICNLWISCIIGILLVVKKLFKKILTSRMQYNLWFLLFILLLIPFVPLKPTKFFSIFTLFSNIPQSGLPNNDIVSHTTNETIFENNMNWMNDFTLSITQDTSSIFGLILGAVWIIGVLTMIILVTKSVLRLHMLKKSALSLQNVEVRKIYYSCLDEMNLKKDIPIYSTAFLKSPIIVGIWKPCIYLPIHLISDYNTSDLRYMLLHELQHYKYRDNITNYFMILIRIIYWFNPIVLVALKEMCHDREIACDSSVLKMLEYKDYINYGNTLINFAEKISTTPFPFVAGLGGNMKQIKRRILNIASYENPTYWKRIKGLIAFFMTAILLFGCSPMLSTYASEECYTWDTSSKKITLVDLSSYFDGYKGSFVLYDLQKDNWNIYDIEQATIRISPNSTYKIYDALFALEENIITSENSFISCPQQNYPFESWNEDQTLFSAMNSSVTWYFQALDAKLGKSNLQSYIEQIGYGNQNINGELSSYWMESSLKISPIEQVELLTSLYFNDFGFTPENIQTTKESIQLFSDVNCTIYGKTGTGCIEEKNVNGWFIGFVESKNHTYFFATNIQAIDNATGSIASEITLSILSDMNIYKL